MPAYVIADLEVTDPAGFEEYRSLVGPTVAAYGGKYLVRGGKVELLEGEWSPQRFVVIEFESMAQAKRWWSSPEYSAAKDIRQQAAKSNLIIVEGI